MRSLLVVIVFTCFLTGCVVVPASYVPTTGKVGTQSGTSCVFLLLGLIPFGDRVEMLSKAVDDAGNPTKDVAVINSTTWWFIGSNQCVTVKGSS
jgi:hypothetical protein